MNGFEYIAPGVFHLAPPVPEFGGGVTLVIGSSKFLIGCGAFDYSVSKFIVPALKAMKLDVKDIDYVLFTNCHPENIGGLHKLKQLAPDIKVMSYGHNQTDRLKNPSYYFMQTWADFLDYSPPFRELRGVLCDGTINTEDQVFAELKPIFAQGYDNDCVCWFHTQTETLICGNAVQGGGTEETGVAFITSLEYYKNTLSDLIELAPQNMISSYDHNGVPAVITGRDVCQKALEHCYDHLDNYLVYVDRYSRLTRVKKENLNPEDVAIAYFEDKKQPGHLGYAMHTFRQFIKPKR